MNTGEWCLTQPVPVTQNNPNISLHVWTVHSVEVGSNKHQLRKCVLIIQIRLSYYRLWRFDFFSVLQEHDWLWRPEWVSAWEEAAPMAWIEPRSRPDAEREGQLTPYNLRTQISTPAFSSTIPQVQPSILAPVLILLLTAFADLCIAGPPQPARPPLLSGQPFIIFWGIPNSACSGRTDPRTFGMEQEGRVALFYEDMLGNYPYFVDKDTPVNGGLPQHTRLDNHLQKTQQDLEAALPAPRYLGLGVLRWAEWSPQWFRNREKQIMYLEASRNLLKNFFPSWTPEEVEKWSQVRWIEFKGRGDNNNNGKIQLCK